MQLWNKKTKSVWVRNCLRNRSSLGAYGTLLSELREEDGGGGCLNFMRVTPGLFEHLVQLVTLIIRKEYTNMREAISPGMRL